MNRSSSDKLYKLIWSMSKSEKRYFKIYAERDLGRKNNFSLKLFDLVSKNEPTSIAEIEAQITFTKHPSKLKNYLYDFVLQSLENYASKSNEKIQLSRTLNQIEILFERGLFDQCLSLIKKAEKKALKVDDQIIISELNLWNIRITKQIYQPKKQKSSKDLIKKRAETLSSLMLENDYWEINTYIFELITQSGMQSKQQALIEEALSNKLLADKNIPKTLYSKRLFNNSWFLYYTYIGNMEKRDEIMKQNLALFDNKNELKTYYPYTYFAILNNAAVASLANKKYKQSEAYFDLLLLIKPKTIQQASTIFEYYAGNKLSLPLYHGGFEKSLELIPYVEKGLIKYGNRISPLFKLTIHANACYVLFVTGNLKKSLKFMNYMLNEEVANIRIDVARIYRLVNLLIHFELGNIGLTEYLLDSLKRKFKKIGTTYLIEEWFIVFFSGLLKSPYDVSKEFMVKSERKLLKVLQNENEQNLMDNFNFAIWIQCKVDNVDFGSAIREFNVLGWEKYIESRKK